MKENVKLLETNPQDALLSLKKLPDQYIKSDQEEAFEIVFKILDVLARNNGDNHPLLKESEIVLKLAKELNAFKQLSYLHQYQSAAYFNEGLLDLGYRELITAIPYTNKIADTNNKNITLARLYISISSYYVIKDELKNGHMYIDKSIAKLKLVNDTSANILLKYAF